MVIGNNLYKITKAAFGNNEYHFHQVDNYSIDNNFANQYPVYSVSYKNKKSNDKMINVYKNIVWTLAVCSKKKYQLRRAMH